MAMRTLFELRKLTNYLIITGQIEQETRVVVEVARELNDANMRWAIEHYQNRRREENKEFALEINKNGIIDNISMAKAGLINWENIEKFEILKSSGHQHLFVFVKQPEKYIQNVKGFKKGMVNQLFKDNGSPIAIDLRRIKYDAKELLTILEKEKTHNK